MLGQVSSAGEQSSLEISPSPKDAFVEMLDPPLQLIKGQGWATYPVPVTKEPGFETWVTDVVIDGRGFPWVGTNRGLYPFNPSGNWQTMLYNFVVDLDVDSQRRIWVATEQQIYVIDKDGKKMSYPAAYGSDGLYLSTTTGFE